MTKRVFLLKAECYDWNTKSSPNKYNNRSTAQDSSVTSSSTTSDIKQDLHRGQVFWSCSSHLSKQFLWKMWQQFVNWRISSAFSNSLRQTAQVTASDSPNLSANMLYSITGRHFLIISAETLEAASTEFSGRSGHVASDSRKSANPIDLRNQHMPFLIVDSKKTALNSILEIINPEYSAGNPIT